MTSVIIFCYVFFQNALYLIPVFVAGLLLIVGLFVVARPVYGFLILFVYVSVLASFIYVLSRNYEPIYRYIHAHGATGELVISKYRGTGNVVNHVETQEGVGFLEAQDGSLLEVVVPLNPTPHYPPLRSFFLNLNAPYKVRYLAEKPSVYVFDFGTPEEAAKLEACMVRRDQANDQLRDILSKMVLQPSNSELRAEQARVAKLLGEPCAK